MPAVSERQRRAMWAAAEGNSKLGIPQTVGREFVKADANQTAPELGDLSDFEAMEAMRDGEIPSPTKYGDFWLFDLRITGTGMAWRDKLGEWAFRDPETWTSPEFVQRCNGLPVIMDHPEDGGLNHEEFQERAIGQIHLPYVKGEEVWGIAKIYNSDAALMMQNTHRSTSPGVTAPKGAAPISLEGGAKVLDEGLPQILDHLAVCEAGVWDKDGPPEGVRLDSLIGKGEVVADKSEREKELEKALEDSNKRADAAEKEREDAKSRADGFEKERDDAKKRADESESELEKHREDAKRRDNEMMDAKRKDARKSHHDAKKHDGEYLDCSRCDSEKEEIEKELEDGKRKDSGAPSGEVEPNRQTEIMDSLVASNKRMEAEIARLTAAQAPLSNDDRTAIANIFSRYDALFKMLGESGAPAHMPGEKPSAYRRRVADSLRKHTKSFKDTVIHDSVDGRAFDVLEDAIIAEARAEAKNPTFTDSTAFQLRAVTTHANGKSRTEWQGDPRGAFAPFRAVMNAKITRFNTPQRGVA